MTLFPETHKKGLSSFKLCFLINKLKLKGGFSDFLLYFR